MPRPRSAIRRPRATPARRTSVFLSTHPRMRLALLLSAPLFWLGLVYVVALAALPPVPGRMQKIAEQPGRPLVVVDYAHTPDALEKVLEALRPHAHGKLLCLFGEGIAIPVVQAGVGSR